MQIPKQARGVYPHRADTFLDDGRSTPRRSTA